MRAAETAAGEVWATVAAQGVEAAGGANGPLPDSGREDTLLRGARSPH